MSNSTLKKTIQVNPELFKMGNRSRKAGNAEKVVLPKPVINPYSVKQKLLGRLQERKKAEIKSSNVGSLGIKPKPYILSESENLLNDKDDDKKEDEFLDEIQKNIEEIMKNKNIKDIDLLSGKSMEEKDIKKGVVKDELEYIEDFKILDLGDKKLGKMSPDDLPEYIINYQYFSIYSV